MKIETLERMKADDLYKFSAVPFIEKLQLLGIPLSAITTNDWHCNYNPRVYVTREYGRKNGGKTKGYHITRLNNKHAERLATFYKYQNNHQ